MILHFLKSDLFLVPNETLLGAVVTVFEMKINFSASVTLRPRRTKHQNPILSPAHFPLSPGPFANKGRPARGPVL